MPTNKLDDYEVLSVIGTGSYGICKKIRRKSDGKIRVWKELDYGTMTDSEKQLLVSEVNLLRELKHENIVRYHNRIIDKAAAKIYIIMEYCEGGDLSGLITKHKKERKYIVEDFIWQVLYQLSSALKECHLCSPAGSTVMHRDLKPANVFLDAHKNCKLGDFGSARVLHHETSFAKTFVGTPYYMSPELVNRCNYNEKSDIWSLGCLIYELCALVPPFLAANQRLLGLKIKEGHFKPIPTHYSKELQKIIECMLTVVETRRPSIQDLLNSQHVLKRATRIIPSVDKKQEITQTLFNRKEEELKLREQKLDEREKEIERKERLLSERERLFEERTDRHFPSQKRLVLDFYSNKENHPLLCQMDYGQQHKHENIHGSALRFLDQNPRYESRAKPSFTGFR